MYLKQEATNGLSQTNKFGYLAIRALSSLKLVQIYELGTKSTVGCKILAVESKEGKS